MTPLSEHYISEVFPIVAIICEYENSIELSDEERVTCVDDDRHIHFKVGDENYAQFKEYADKCKEYLRFGYEVDEATFGNMSPLEQVKVCNTPQILLDAGFKQKPMLYTQRHLEDALHPKSIDNSHWHGLSVSQLKRLPELLEIPVMLADSPARRDSLLAVLCAVDDEHLPLIVPIKPDGRGHYQLQDIETNNILSVYGKDDFPKYFAERITSHRLVYFNEERGHVLETLAELQLFRCHFIEHNLCNIIIRQPECLVNMRRSAAENEHGADLDHVQSEMSGGLDGPGDDALALSPVR